MNPELAAAIVASVRVREIRRLEEEEDRFNVYTLLQIIDEVDAVMRNAETELRAYQPPE